MAAPHQPGTKPRTRLFSVASSKEIDLAEMRSTGQRMAGGMRRPIYLILNFRRDADEFFSVRVF